MDIRDHEFERIRKVILAYFGIKLSDEKRSLVVGRLQSIIREKGLTSFEAYFDHVETDASGRELGRMIDRLTTNHTFFFREQRHFDFLRFTILPDIEAVRTTPLSRNLRLWCAGCSAGDEAYSYMIHILEYFGERYHTWNAGVLATDISEKMLNEARRGIYPAKRLAKVPSFLKFRYFKATSKGMYQILESVRQEVTFRRLNLKNNTFPFKHDFDVISCRNVMIYFDQDMKDHLVQAFYSLIRPGGYLFVGHSESLNRKNLPFRYITPGIYRREA